MSIRFGIELEFIGPGRWYLGRVLQRHAVPMGTTYDKWTLATDGSVMNDRETCEKLAGPYGFSGYECCELRTPMMDPDNAEHLAEIRRVLDIVALLDCHTTRSSGMHVHISSSDENEHVHTANMSVELEEKYRKYVQEKRLQYCRPGVSWGKDGAIRVISPGPVRLANGTNSLPASGNHVEVRIFNSTLDFKKLERRLKKSVEVYRKYLGQPIPISEPAPATTIEQAPAPQVPVEQRPGYLAGCCNCEDCLAERVNRGEGLPASAAAPAAAL